MKLVNSVQLRVAALCCALLLAVSAVGQAQWTEARSIPATGDLWGFATAYHNGTIYTFGGVTGGSTQISSSTLRYSVAGDSWTTGPGLFTFAYSNSAAVVGDKIYIFGGTNGSQTVDNFLNTTTIFDPVQGSMSQGPPMPQKVYSATAFSVGGKAYVVGGIMLNMATSSLQTHSDVFVFDPATGWSTLTGNAPYPGFDLQSTVIGSTIYVAGGVTAGGQGIPMAYKGTVASGTITWTRIADLPMVVAGGGMTSWNGKPFIAGGYSTVQGFTSSYIYDEASNTWEAFYPLPSQRSQARMTGDGTTPYLIGGQGTLEMLMAEEGDAVAIAEFSPYNFSFAMEPNQVLQVSLPIANRGIINLQTTLTFNDTPWVTGGTLSVNPNSASALTASINTAGIAPGRYTVTGTVATNDADNPSIPVSFDIWVVADLKQEDMTVVLEEAHGTWCPPCGTSGIPSVEALEAQYGDRLVVLSYHDKGGNRYDPFSLTAGEALNNRLELNAYPTGAVQRWTWGGTKQLSAGSEWAAGVATVMASSPYAAVSVDVEDYNYDPATRRVTGNVVISTATPISLGSSISMNLTSIVKENGYRYTQAFSHKPAEVIAHENVVRHFYPDNDGAELIFPVENYEDDILKPGATITVPVDFIVPASTTPTSTGDLSSVPVRADSSHIVFLVTLNSGQALGPILGVEEMELNQQSTTPGPAISITWSNQTTKEIEAGQTAQFQASVANLTDEPVTVQLNRASNSMPAGWTSQICTGASDCDDVDDLTYEIPANGTQQFFVKINGATADETGQVRLIVSYGDIIEERTFTAITDVSGIAVAGEANGLAFGTVSPNPASSIARVDVTIPRSNQTTLEVYTVDGQKVATLFEGRLEAGSRQIDADVSTLQSGLYVLVLTSGETKVSRTLTVVR